MRYDSLLECFKLLCVAHDLIPFLCSDGVFHRSNQCLQPFLLGLQSGQVTAQRGQTVKGRIVQAFFDLCQLHPKRTIIENVLQSVDLCPAVIAVTALRHPAGLEQTDLVVPAQGAGGHPGQARQLLNGIFHVHPSLPTV